MGASENIFVFDESLSSLDNSLTWADDEFPPPTFNGLDHGTQAVGNALRGVCVGANGHLYLSLSKSTELIPTITTSVGNHCVLLPDLRGFDFHRQQQGHCRRYGKP